MRFIFLIEINCEKEERNTMGHGVSLCYYIYVGLSCSIKSLELPDFAPFHPPQSSPPVQRRPD